MKKAVVLTVLLAVAFVGVAQADIQVNWGGLTGFYNHTAVPGSPADPGDYLLSGGGSVMAYLIWSPDNAIDNLTLISAAVLVRPLVDGGNDILLNSFSVVNNPYADYAAGPAQYLNANFGGNTLQTGYIYARIFEGPVADLVYYNDGPIVSAAPYTFTGSEPPVLYDQNTGDPAAGGQCDQQLTVIPEPSTIMLSILGLGMIMVRRFRK